MKKSIFAVFMAFFVAFWALPAADVLAGEHGGKEHGGKEHGGHSHGGSHAEIKTLMEASEALAKTNPRLSKKLAKMAKSH